MRIVALLLGASALASATDVLTHHNNLARTGAVLDEKLSSLPSIAQDARVRQTLLSRVDGQIYAQPLVVTGLAIPGKGTRNVVYVATMRNMVYAFDADKPSRRPFGRSTSARPCPTTASPKTPARSWANTTSGPISASPARR